MSESTVEEDRSGWAEAMGARDWERAYALLSEESARRELSGNELEILAEASRWTRRYSEMVEALERAAEAYERAEQREEAGRLAVELSIEHYQRNELALAGGFLARADELLRDSPDCRASGLAMFCRTELLIAAGEPEKADAQATAMAELARRIEDRDLEALALMMRGRAQHLSGAFGDGAALMDQAAAGAIAGNLELWTSGVVLCANISACRQRWDVRTASEWSDAAVRWCRRNSVGYFPGLCRLHMGESLNMRGEYDAAAEEVASATDDLRAAMPRFAADGLHELGEVRRRQGELEAAGQLFQEAIELGGDALPGLMRLRLDEGRPELALALARDRLDDPLGGSSLSGGRAHVLPTAIEAAVEARDLELGGEWLAELEELADACGTPALDAAARTAGGRIALAGAALDEAVSRLAEARRLWAEIGAPYEEAMTRLLLARARLSGGDRGRAAIDAESAAGILRKIGARFAVTQAENLLANARGTVQQECMTMLFTDIVGSTRLVEALGDEAWEALLRWHDRALVGCVEEAGGIVLKHEGDGIFASFEDADRALDCACEIQRKLAKQKAEHGYAPSVRIGVHADAVTDRGGDVSGRGVHVAARVMAAAGGGEILVSESTLSLATDARPVAGRRELEAKGIADPVAVCALGWA